MLECHKAGLRTGFVVTDRMSAKLRYTLTNKYTNITALHCRRLLEILMHCGLRFVYETEFSVASAAALHDSSMSCKL